MSRNVVVLVGIVGQDAKSGQTKTGTTWANVSVATQKKSKDETYKTVWHRVVAFGKTAEKLSQAKKSDHISVFGELDYNTYDKDGAQVTIAQVLCQEAVFASKEAKQYDQRYEQDSATGDVPF